jgi:hypothetical protein
VRRTTRASDEDRDNVARALRGHAVAGRLTVEELEERLGGAFAARTLRELDELLADLPRRRGRSRTVPALMLQGVAMLLVGLLIVTIAILLAIAWAGSRLVAAAAAQALDRRRVRGLRAGPRPS